VDLRALYEAERIESVGHTWRPMVRAKKPSTATQFASPDEYARIRDAMLADGADEDWVDWALSTDAEA
jgi:hypothetical protein